MIVSSICLTLTTLSTASEKLSYDGYKVYRVNTGKHLEEVHSKLEISTSSNGTMIALLILTCSFPLRRALHSKP
jgi:hypothetical protein